MRPSRFSVGKRQAAQSSKVEPWQTPSNRSLLTRHRPPLGPYSQAVRVGNLVYTSGQVALDPATGQVSGTTAAEQTTRVFENLKAVLEAAGTDLARVFKTVVFLKNMGDFVAMNEVYARYLAAPGVVSPARSTVEVARLPKDVLVEIEVIRADLIATCVTKLAKRHLILTRFKHA